MLKQLINGESRSITSAALVIGAASLASRLLGVLRDRILAGQFGAGQILDMYYAAFRIPDFVYTLLIMGALSAGFIPVFLSHLKSGGKEAWNLANGVLNVIVIATLAVLIILFVLAPYLVPLMVPGFNLEARETTVALTRIMFLSPVLLGISAVFSGILQSYRRFFVYSLAPILYNIGIIIGALFFTPFWGVYGLAYGVVLGAFLHMIIQLLPVYLLGLRYQWFFAFYHPGIRRIIKLMIPRSLSLAITQVNLLIITIIASTLASGSIAVFNFANNLQSFPLGIFGLSLAVASFPTLSNFAARDQIKDFVRSFSSTTRQILFFILPASVLLLVLRAQIVRIILGTGQFDWEDTILTFQSLGFFSFSLFAQALIPHLARAFFSLHNTKTPFFIGLVSAIINIIACLILVRPLEVAGLALAFTIASIFNMVLLWVALRMKIGPLEESRIIVSVFKISVASLLMGAAVQAAKRLVAPLVDMQTFLGVFTQGFVAGVMGVGVFVVISLLLRSPEMIVLIDSLKRKFLKKAPLPPGGIEEGKL